MLVLLIIYGAMDCCYCSYYFVKELICILQ